MVAYSEFDFEIMNLPGSSQKKWELTLMDAGDGSGDGYIRFPIALLAQINWKEGDIINLEVVDDHLLITKVDV